jgi:hypothetical protein
MKVDTLRVVNIELLSTNYFGIDQMLCFFIVNIIAQKDDHAEYLDWIKMVDM